MAFKFDIVKWPKFILFPDSIVTDIELFLHNVTVAINDILKDSTPENTHNYAIIFGTKNQRILEQTKELLDASNGTEGTNYYMGSIIENYAENGILPENFTNEYKNTIENTTVTLLVEDGATEELGIHICQQFILKNMNLDIEKANSINIFELSNKIKKEIQIVDYFLPSRLIIAIGENNGIFWEIKSNVWIVKKV
jgi:hypothetical protein